MGTNNTQDTVARVAAELREICDAWESDHNFPDGMLGDMADRLDSIAAAINTDQQDALDDARKELADKMAECERLQLLVDRTAPLCNDLSQQVDDTIRLARDLQKDRDELKRKADGALAAFPLFDDAGLDEHEHCCEWSLQQDRKRLHASLAGMTTTRAPGVDAAISAALRHSPNGQAGESTDYCKGWRDAIEYVATRRSTATPLPPTDDARDAARMRFIADRLTDAERNEDDVGVRYQIGFALPPNHWCGCSGAWISSATGFIDCIDMALADRMGENGATHSPLVAMRKDGTP